MPFSRLSTVALCRFPTDKIQDVARKLEKNFSKLVCLIIRPGVGNLVDRRNQPGVGPMIPYLHYSYAIQALLLNRSKFQDLLSTSTFSNPRSYYLDRGPRDLKQNNMRSSASKRTRFPNFHASSRAGNSANQTIFLLRKSSVCGRLLWLVASLFISFFVTRLLTKHVLTVYRGTAKKEISTDKSLFIINL